MSLSIAARSYPLHGSIALFLATLVAPLATPSARGDVFTWDSDPAVVGTQDGGGIWDAFANNWVNAGANGQWIDGDLSEAVFGTGVDGDFTIDVTFFPIAERLTFNSSGYILSAATAQTITVSSATSSIFVAPTKTATIGSNVKVSTKIQNANSVVSGGGKLVIESGGTLSNAGTMPQNVLNINSSTVEVRTGGNLLTANGNAIFVNGTLDVLGGNVDAVGTLGIGQSSTPGTLTVSSGTVRATSTNGIRFGSNNASGTSEGGTVNLDGGSLRAEIISKGTSTVTSSVFNFNGGTLVADTTLPGTSVFMQGLTRANVRNGGAIIDTAGSNITIAQALEHSDIVGDNPTDGGLTKKGGGVLTLAGANSYTGATTIDSGGALRLSHSLALGTLSILSAVGNKTDLQLQLSNNIVVTNQIRLYGAGLDGILKNVDGNNTLTNFQLTGVGGTRLHVVAGSTLNLPNAITFSGAGGAQNLRVVGTGTLSLGGNNSAVLTSSFSFLLGSDTAAGPTIQVGHDAAFGAGTIDFRPLANSTITSSDATAHTLANKLNFNDQALNHQATFGSATTGDLTFTGATTLGGNLEASIQNSSTTLSGAISGTASLTKVGPGTLVLSGASANTFTGGVFVNVGILDARKDSALGTGNVSVADGATLKLELATNNNYISDTGKLLLAVGSPVVQLAFTGTPDKVAGLSFDGGVTFAAMGIWGSPTSGAQFTSAAFVGTGTLNVVPEPSSAALLLTCATLLGLRRRRA